MKNSIILAITILFSINLYSLVPNIGDMAQYRTTNRHSTQGTQTSVWKKTILEFEDTDYQTMALIRWESVSPIDPSTEVEEWLVKDLLHYISSTEDYCQRNQNIGYNAKLEMITVPAGRFMACKMTSPMETRVVWYSSEVPFGVVKAIYYGQNSTSTNWLVEYKN